MNGDSEEENYLAKYGFIDITDEHFDDHPYLGFEFLQYKISKIKIWTAKKDQSTVLGGIQTFYLNKVDGKDYISKEYKGEKVDKNSFVEFNLEKNEYIIKSSLWFNDVICRIVFQTNLKKKFEVGDIKGDETIVDELDKNKMVLSFFGSYNDNYLTHIGMFINKKDEFFDIFIRGLFELKIFIKKDKNESIIQEKIKKNEYDQETIALIKTCQLPYGLIQEIIKYINFL